MARNARNLLTATGGRTNFQKVEMERFAHKLHQAMVKKGMSQSDLAAAMWGRITDSRGYEVAKGRDRISVWLKGGTYPDAANLKKLSEIFKMDPLELAPDVMASTVEKENPEIALTAAPGHPDKVFFRLAKLIPLDVATQLMTIINAHENKTATAKNK